jgi:hypothetical protein
MKGDVKRFILSTLTRLQSKKFIVWTVASVAMFTGFLQSTDWMYITTMYLGAQGLIDFQGSTANKGLNEQPVSSSSPS